MQKWEYMWTHIDSVNEAGFEGWEAIGFLPVFDGQYNALMKRPISGEPVEMALTEFVEYGVWSDPSGENKHHGSGWLRDSTGRVLCGSAAAMRAQVQGIDASWGAEVRPLPS
jgi:hypothetical protein